MEGMEKGILLFSKSWIGGLGKPESPKYWIGSYPRFSRTLA
jgi:hypothetical protein